MDYNTEGSLRISVIVPSYKPKEYLWQCLDSLCNQTLQKAQYEIIIILNGCKEPYESAIHKYIISHAEVNFVFLQTDQSGVSNARNIGIDRSSGEYVSFIDDDDFVSANYLSSLLNHASRDTIALSNTVAIDDGNNQMKYSISEAYDKLSNLGRIPFYRARRFFSGPCMKLIHNQIIDSGQGKRFNVNYRNGEDSLFMFDISENVKYVDFTPPDAIYYRRIRAGSASQSQMFRNRLRNCFRIILEYNRVFFRYPSHYNCGFFLTRIMGALKTVFIK